MRRWVDGLAPVLLALILRLALDPVLEDKSPFLLFTLAVMLAAAYGGFWVGTAATLIGGVAGLVFLAIPRGVGNIFRAGHWLQPLLYLVVCAGVSYFIEAVHRTRRRIEAYAAEQTKLAAQLGEANRTKDEFLATLSHELRTPLTAIVGWANVLKTGSLEGAEAARAIDVIHRNATIQQQLISDILDIARITSGKLRLDPHGVDPVLAVTAAAETIQPAAQARNIDLELKTEPGLVVWGDLDRLQQVVWNLLSNAVKFTPPGGRVAVELAALGTSVHITVCDAGPGLRPEFISHAFESFRQDDTSSTRSHGGLGLGLAIVKHIVELHGGTVSASNRTDCPGARFEVVLPLMARSRAASDRRDVLRTWTRRRSRQLAGVRVLVVDDEEDARNLIAWVLRSAGAEVSAVESVREALRSIESAVPDVILTDIAMPHEDGYALLKKIQAFSPAQQIPTAAISAYTGDRERARAINAGFQAHLSKPVDPDALASTVESLAVRRSA